MVRDAENGAMITFMKTSCVIVVTVGYVWLVYFSINSVVYFSNLSIPVPVPGPIFHTGVSKLASPASSFDHLQSLKLEVGKAWE